LKLNNKELEDIEIVEDSETKTINKTDFDNPDNKLKIDNIKNTEFEKKAHKTHKNTEKIVDISINDTLQLQASDLTSNQKYQSD